MKIGNKARSSGGGSSQKEEKWGLTRQKQWLNKWIKIKKQKTLSFSENRTCQNASSILE